MWRFQAVRRVLLVLAVPAVTLAQGAVHPTLEPHARISRSVVFRTPDRSTMRDYFRSHSIFATKLPARVSKNVTRGKPLPRGAEEGAAPSGLVELLPIRPGVTYLVVGADVVAMRHGVVVDVVYNVFR